MNPAIGDRLGGLLQSTVLQICQRIVPFAHDVAVVGNLCIQADSKELCNIPFRERATEKLNPNIADNAKEKETDELFRRSIEAINSLNDNENASPSPAVKVNNYVPKTPNNQANICFKTPSPRAGELATMKTLTGSRQSLVDTLVKEAMKVWYNEGPSPDRIRCEEMRVNYAQDSQKTAAVELGIEAMSKYGEISPETLEAAAQLRRLGEQPQFINKPPVAPQQIENVNVNGPVQPTVIAPIDSTPLASRPKHARKQKLIVNPDYESPRKTSKKMPPPNTPLKNTKGMYECDVCGKEFTFATNLTRHQRNFHGRPYTRKNKEETMKKNRLLGLSSQSNVDSSSTEDDVESVQDHVENNANLANQNHNGSAPKHLDENRNLDMCNSVNSAPNMTIASNSDNLANKSYMPGNVDNSNQPEESCDSNSVTSDSTDVSNGTYSNGQKYVYMSVSQANTELKYACKICHRKFQHYRNLARHLKVSHDITITDYEKDGPAVPIKAGSGQKVKGQGHIPPDKHVCKICGHAFSFASNLYRHMTKAHRSPKSKAAGKVLKKAIRKASSSSASEDDSNDGSPGRYTCDMCDAVFTKTSNLSRHYRKVHKVVKVALPQQPGSNSTGDQLGKGVRQPEPTVTTVEKNPSRGVAGALHASNYHVGVSTTGPLATPSQPPATAPLPQPLSQAPVPLGPHHPAPSQMFTQQLQMSVTTSQLSPLLHPGTFPPFLNPHSTTEIANHFPRSPGLGMLPHSQYPPLMGAGLPRFTNTNHGPPGLNPQPQQTPYCGPDMLSPVSSDISPNTSHSSDNTSPPQQNQQPLNHISNTPISKNLNTMPSQQSNLPNLPLQQSAIHPPTQYMPPCQESTPESQAPAANGHTRTDDQRRHVCSICSQEFNHKTEFLGHLKNVHKILSPETTDSDNSSKPPAPKKHCALKQATPITSVPLKIPVIPNPFLSKPPVNTTPKKSKSSRAPKSKDSPTSPKYRHTCPVCNWNFSFRTNLTRHMKKQHGLVPDFGDLENHNSQVSNLEGSENHNGQALNFEDSENRNDTVTA